MKDVKITYKHKGKIAYWLGKKKTLVFEYPKAEIIKIEPINP